VIGEYLASRLEELKRYGVIREVRGRGLLRGVELVTDTTSNKPFPELGKALRLTALKNGLIMKIDPTWFAVCPPLTCTKADIDEMMSLVDASLRDALSITVRE